MGFKVKAKDIKGNTSILLDSLRIVAALTVLYIHAFDRWFPNLAHPLSKPGEPSHAAVTVFFVLSGYVIAHTTISKNRGGRQYAIARLSRLSSMVIPALLITSLAALIVGYLDANLLALYSRGHELVRYIACGLFINELWFFSAAPPLNPSLWSLSFEFWYYVIFGFWFFRKGGWLSYVLPVVSILIAGPKIMLMMPVWLLGYLAYVLPRPKIAVSTAWVLVTAGAVVSLFTILYLPSYPNQLYVKPLYFASQFVTDWVVAFFMAFTLWLLPSGNNININSGVVAWLRKIADLTFPLYILHFPLLVLWQSIFGFQLNNSVQFWEATVSVLFVACFAGVLLEWQRPVWDKIFRRILQ